MANKRQRKTSLLDALKNENRKLHNQIVNLKVKAFSQEINALKKELKKVTGEPVDLAKELKAARERVKRMDKV